MDTVIKKYYHFRDGLKVELLHRVNNLHAAEKAMFNAYKRCSKDIASSYVALRPAPGNAYTTFDGTKFN